MTDGYIKLWRKSLDGDMIKNHNLWVFWTWCLLKASHKEYKVKIGFQEVDIKPGQFIFGLNVASRETNLTIQKIRYAIRSLVHCQNITIKSTNKFSVISIVNWDIYQNDNCKKNKQTNKPVTNKEQTNNNIQECKEGKEEDKEINTNVFTKKVELLEKTFTPDELLLKNDFIEYWTEKSENGTKERWEFEKVFDVNLRFRTWLRNNKKRFNRGNKLNAVSGNNRNGVYINPDRVFKETDSYDSE